MAGSRVGPRNADAIGGGRVVQYRIVSAILAALVLFGLPASSAMAADFQVTATVNLRSGPGTNFAVIGQLAPNQVVSEIRCNGVRTWCEVRAATLRGWVSAAYLRPVQSPAPQAPVEVTPRPGLALPAAPRVCFYDQPDFRGRALCSGIGDGYPTLAPSWDNAIRSVTVEGRLSVTACTGPAFTGTCATLDRSYPALGWLSADISSYRVDGF